MSVRCPTCDLVVAGPCPNYWCSRPDRGFDTVWSIGSYEGRLRRAITALKYRGQRRWVAPLAGLLSAYVIDRSPCFEDVDLIVGVPAGSGVDHVGSILRAAVLGRWWEVDARGAVIGKRAVTPRLAGAGIGVRRLRAACDLRAALEVRDPSRVSGRRVLVVDDVFTDGSTLREVAGVLRGAGAAAVSGLVLARATITGGAT